MPRLAPLFQPQWVNPHWQDAALAAYSPTQATYRDWLSETDQATCHHSLAPLRRYKLGSLQLLPQLEIDASKRRAEQMYLGSSNRRIAGSQDVHFKPKPSQELFPQARLDLLDVLTKAFGEPFQRLASITFGELGVDQMQL